MDEKQDRAIGKLLDNSYRSNPKPANFDNFETKLFKLTEDKS